MKTYFLLGALTAAAVGYYNSPMVLVQRTELAQLQAKAAQYDQIASGVPAAPTAVQPAAVAQASPTPHSSWMWQGDQTNPLDTSQSFGSGATAPPATTVNGPTSYYYTDNVTIDPIHRHHDHPASTPRPSYYAQPATSTQR